MNSKKVVNVVLLFSVAVSWSCEKRNAPHQPFVYRATENVIFQISEDSSSVFSAQNDVGSLILQGLYNQSGIDVRVEKSVLGPSKEQALAFLAEITHSVKTWDDTTRLHMTGPFWELEREYDVDLYLNVPGSKPIFVHYVRDGFYSYGMDTDVNILFSEGSITLDAMQGKISAFTKSGNIKLEMAIGNSGNCSATTEDGNIVVELFGAIEFSFRIEAPFGEINFEGLNPKIEKNSLYEVVGKFGDEPSTLHLKTKTGNVTLRDVRYRFPDLK